jgi:hypothetical protein
MKVNAKERTMEGFSSKSQKAFPSIINVCVYRGACPCKCVHCPVGIVPIDQRKEQFGLHSMKLDLFKKIVDEVSTHNESVLRIHSVGEPLLWENLVPAITYAKQKGVKTWIFTSAVTKDISILYKLAENCSIIEFSVNSIDAENYRLTKGIDEYKLVFDNIKKVSDYKKKNSLPVRLICSRVESSDKGYDKKFSEYWKESGLVDDSFVRSYHNYNNVLSSKDKNEYRNTSPCLVHWARFNIDSNGEAVICFNELFKCDNNPEEIVYGDVNNSLISELWQSDKINKIRDAQLSGDYSKLDFIKKLPCAECKFCQPLDTKRETSETQLSKISCKC